MRKIVEKSMLGRAWIAPVYNDDDNDPKNTTPNDLVRRILHARGICDDGAVEKFLNPSIKEYMPDPFVLKDAQIAANVIADAIVRGDKIAIYGDYDVDGITSTAIFVKYLRDLGADVIWHLPTRDGEGYGLNTAAIDDIAAHGARLLITVDCGISGVAEVAYAKSLGIDVVVTDHHSPDGDMPPANAVVNPKRTDDTSGLEYLAGVGVAFLILVAVNRELKNRTDVPAPIQEKLHNENLLNFMDWVALGTICDTMPLVNLNRAFVATGLKVMGLRHNLGLRVLMDLAAIKTPSVYAAGFAIGPRLNAAGRLDSAAPALDLLLTDNPLIAQDLATKLHQMNQDRIDIQNAIMLSASDMADRAAAAGRCSLFVCGDRWHGGVMGIIAGRLKDKYNLPTCVATRSDGMINGSGRSIPGVDLGQIIHDALGAGILAEGGGHAAAAGFTLRAENESQFRDYLENAVTQQLGGVRPTVEIAIDAEMDAGAATMDLVERLTALEPFGQGNPEPMLALRGARLKSAQTMGNGAHLRGAVMTRGGGTLNFVGFNMVATPVGDFLLDDANINTPITLAGRLKKNEFKGRVSAQFFVEDIAVE